MAIVSAAVSSEMQQVMLFSGPVLSLRQHIYAGIWDHDSNKHYSSELGTGFYRK